MQPSDGSNAKGLRLVSQSDLNDCGNGGQIVVRRMGKSKTLAVIAHMAKKAFSIVDVSNPTKPELVFQQPAYAGTLSHKARIYDDRYLVLNCEKARDPSVTTFDSGFRIFDLKDEGNPKEISFTRVQGDGIHRFWVDPEESLLYAPSYIDGFSGRILLIFDISQPQRPRVICRWWYPGQNVSAGEVPFWAKENRSFRAHGPPIRIRDRIYLGYWDAGVLILDCSDIARLNLVSQRNLCPPYGGCTHTVLPITREIAGRKWIAVTDEAIGDYPNADLDKFLWLMDVTNEKNIVPVSAYRVNDPKLFSRLTVGSFGPHNLNENDLSVANNELYVCWYSGGVRVLDITDPFSLREKAYFIPKHDPKKQAAIQTNDLCVDERGLIYCIDRWGAGLHILEKYAT